MLRSAHCTAKSILFCRFLCPRNLCCPVLVSRNLNVLCFRALAHTGLDIFYTFFSGYLSVTSCLYNRKHFCFFCIFLLADQPSPHLMQSSQNNLQPLVLHPDCKYLRPKAHTHTSRSHWDLQTSPLLFPNFQLGHVNSFDQHCAQFVPPTPRCWPHSTHPSETAFRVTSCSQIWALLMHCLWHTYTACS